MMYSELCTLYSGGGEVRRGGSVQPGAPGQNCREAGGGGRPDDRGGVLPGPLPLAPPVPGRDGRADPASPGHGQPEAWGAEAGGPPGGP